MKFISRITKKIYFVLLKGASILTLRPTQLHIQSVLWAVSRYQSGRCVSLMSQHNLVCKLTMSGAVILSQYMTSQRVHEHIYAYLYHSLTSRNPIWQDMHQMELRDQVQAPAFERSRKEPQVLTTQEVNSLSENHCCFTGGQPKG